MPKVQIDIPEDVYKQLKIFAKEDDRSLTKYLVRGMIYLSKIPNGYHNNQTSSSSNHIDLSTLPEGTTIRTKTIKPKTEEELEEERIDKFQKLAKSILSHEIPIAETNLTPDNRYYEYAPNKEGKILRWAYDMPQDKQMEYLNEWKQFE